VGVGGTGVDVGGFTMGLSGWDTSFEKVTEFVLQTGLPSPPMTVTSQL